MHTAYNILQDIPKVAVQVVWHSAAQRLRVKARRWTRHCQRDVWTLDYCGWEGMRCMVGEEGGISAPAPRPPNTWHLYARNVRYREWYEDPSLCREDMWVLFTLREPWRPLRRQEFAAITDPGERIAGHVRLMHAHQQRGRPGAAVVIHGLFTAVLGELAIAAQRGNSGTASDPWRVVPPEEAESEGQRLLDRVDRLVSARLSSPPALDVLAESLAMSVSSLAHRFKAETGMTVVQRIRWLRVREARRLLARPGATVKRVAYALGFSSPAYFTRVFTEVSGIRPIAYLQRARR